MRTTIIVLLTACTAIGVIALLAFLPEPQERLILAPATCAALAPQGLTVTVIPGGCLYTGPVHRKFRDLGLGEFWVPRDAIVAEIPLVEGTK